MFRGVFIAAAATALLATVASSGEAAARAGGARGGHAAYAPRGAAGHYAISTRRAAVARHGAVAVYHGGPYRVGHRYHGGIWYGTGRHWWRGRWYAYGVGPCWLLTPIGYVWVCG